MRCCRPILRTFRFEISDKSFGGLYPIAGKAFNGFLFISREVESAYNRILFGGPVDGKAFNGFLFISRGAKSAYNRILFGGHAPQGASLLLSMGGPFLSVASIYIMYRGSGEKVVRFFVGFVYRSQIKGYICGA